jgi:hypothetical protein
MNLQIILFLVYVNCKYIAFKVIIIFISVRCLRQRLGRERRRSARLLTSLRAARSDLKAYRSYVKNLLKRNDYLRRR